MANYIYIRLSSLILMLCMFFYSVPAWSCSVCGVGADEKTRSIYFTITLVLSLVPVGLILGFVWLYRRRLQQVQG